MTIRSEVRRSDYVMVNVGPGAMSTATLRAIFAKHQSGCQCATCQAALIHLLNSAGS